MTPEKPDDLATQLRLLESRFSNMDVRMALLENKVAVTHTDKERDDKQARENNVPTRVALVENNMKGIFRLMWIILGAIIAGIGTNLFQIVTHGGGK